MNINQKLLYELNEPVNSNAELIKKLANSQKSTSSNQIKSEYVKPYTPIKTAGADSIVPKPAITNHAAVSNSIVNTPSGTVIPNITDSVKGIIGNIGNIASKTHETVKTVFPGATPMHTALGALGAGLLTKKFLNDRRR